MNKEISDLKMEQSKLSGDTVWMNKYYKPYANSDYMKEAFLHKSGIPAKNEILVNIISQKNILTGDFIGSIENYKKYNYNDNIQDKWNAFFLSLYKKIF